MQLHSGKQWETFTSNANENQWLIITVTMMNRDSAWRFVSTSALLKSERHTFYMMEIPPGNSVTVEVEVEVKVGGALLAHACEVRSLLFHAFLLLTNGCTGPCAFTLGWRRRHGNKIQGAWVSRWSLQINKQLLTYTRCTQPKSNICN